MRFYSSLGKLACIACAAFPVAAYANGDASAGFRISLVVPEVCQIESSDIIVDAGSGLATGTVFEACNSGRGFRVMASHRMLADGEQVQINYAGEIRQLDNSGLSDIRSEERRVGKEGVSKCR